MMSDAWDIIHGPNRDDDMREFDVDGKTVSSLKGRLDSIDALELGMALKKHFNLVLSSNKEENKKYFYSVKTLADFIREQKNG